MSDDLARFLLQQIAADEGIAREAVQQYPTWTAQEDDQVHIGESYYRHGVLIYGHSTSRHAEAAHIVRHDPARVLAECEAKRQVVKQYQSFVASDVGMLVKVAICDQLEEVLCLLAHPYADHPGFRPEWRLEPQERQ